MSARKELAEFMETGRLRDAVAGDLSVEAQGLLVNIVSRYCAPRRPPIWKRAVWKRAAEARKD